METLLEIHETCLWLSINEIEFVIDYKNGQRQTKLPTWQLEKSPIFIMPFQSRYTFLGWRLAWTRLFSCKYPTAITNWAAMSITSDSINGPCSVKHWIETLGILSLRKHNLDSNNKMIQVTWLKLTTLIYTFITTTCLDQGKLKVDIGEYVSKIFSKIFCLHQKIWSTQVKEVKKNEHTNYIIWLCGLPKGYT